MRSQRLLLAACAAAISSSVVGAPVANPGDLRRAKTRKPRGQFRGDGQVELSRVLNQALQKSENVTKACDDWSPQELQAFMAAVLAHRSPELDAIYTQAEDRRRMRKTEQEYAEHWQHVNGVVQEAPHLQKPLLHSHCRQAVMWWTHHLSQEAREGLRKNVTVPLLPEEPKLECGTSHGSREERLCAGVEQENSCDWCHSLESERPQPGKHAPDALLPQFVGPDDGNPHGWDRNRRCDQDYKNPPCGPCEGVGGVAWSDKNEDIHLASCKLLKKPDEVDMSTVAKPIYPKAFTNTRYKDVLIGRKTDPFCFAFFPENNSSGVECYRAQDGVAKYYDIENEAVRTDYNIKLDGVFGIFGNITSTVTHVGKYMWIINHLWLGFDQCVCTDPGRDKCTHAPNCSSYAWHYDFAESAQYLGRELIGVEWIGEMELDHFILWSHHMWTDPKTRRLVRLWKPWNGLQVYHPDYWTDSIKDPSVFDTPPAACKKGGAQVRIKCDDDGYFHPTMNEGLELLMQHGDRARMPAAFVI